MSEHECVFVEEQEPSGRLVLPPCIVCGLTAMGALEQLSNPPGVTRTLDVNDASDHEGGH